MFIFATFVCPQTNKFISIYMLQVSYSIYPGESSMMRLKVQFQ